MDPRRPMTCQEVREELVALLDDELDLSMATAVRAHVQSCTACAREAADLETTRGLLDRSLVAEAPGSSRFDELWTAVDGARASDPRAARRSKPLSGTRGSGRRVLSRRAVPMAIAAGLVLAILAYRVLPRVGRPARPAADATTAAAPAEPGAVAASGSAGQIPEELREAPDMFVDFVIVRRLDKLKRLPALLDEEGVALPDGEVDRT